MRSDGLIKDEARAVKHKLSPVLGHRLEDLQAMLTVNPLCESPFLTLSTRSSRQRLPQ